jgi:hypothetical protein
LTTYVALPIERAYLYVSLASEFAAREHELRDKVHKLFGGRLVVLQLKRLVSQQEWRVAMRDIAPEGLDLRGHERLIWVMQNDDHPFIDVDHAVLWEGLALLRADKASRFKCIQPTHWSEALKLSGKFSPPTRNGSYVGSRQTLTDGVLLMNFAFFEYLMLQLDWQGTIISRSDTLVWGRGIYSTRRGALVHTRDLIQTMYVPLRELCRKVDGYWANARISLHDVPPLALPPRSNRPNLPHSWSSLRRMMLSVGSSYWSTKVPNHFQVPIEWVEHAAHLYGIIPHHPQKISQIRNQSHGYATWTGEAPL